ncbi:type II toxin-antitoxin system RelE/ParE family toxin [Candidatus Thiosymbion oneisti]|uniref:type II toxin-antitoxin system RelE/ParE family toxin n=1 Tax=Candidatus Thiosymbion oneisti TaxID=589554 RepID=UPI000B7C768D|nr:type II toxin-antitoxin system RelE/ParE family toxin [Candidatus Thiosymbion oneisti]
MRVKSIRHKGLKRLFEQDDASRLTPMMVPKIRNILAALTFADDLSQLDMMPGWRLHPLTGDRQGQWSITVTGNWRLVFEAEGDEIMNLNLEDYH